MNEVWIYHEGLDRYSQVPESAVGVHAMSGWVQKDPPPLEEPAEEEAAAEAEPKPSTRKSSASRPASDEE